jgi:organic hydroperoxide reductase OsmC/OhrA
LSVTHLYELSLRWTGNNGSGTSSYRTYSRDHEIHAAGKSMIAGSSDPAFRGNASLWNPEELLVASLSQCHMLWYLHLAASAGVVVTAYTDTPIGTMIEGPDGGGQFSEVVLRPEVTVPDAAMRGPAGELHDDAERMCFIARSVNFPVRHEPVTILGHGEVR